MKALEQLLNGRDDIGWDEVRRLTIAAGERGEVGIPRIKAVLDQIAGVGIGGALGNGITAGLSQLLHLAG
jgi:hypothetical protein